MKKAIVLAVLAMMLATLPAFAEDVKVTYGGEPVNYQDFGEGITATVHDKPTYIEGVAGAKFDAPNLIGIKQISPDLYFGVEVGKDLLANPLNDDIRFWLEDDHGYFAYAKITYNGCWLNCPDY